MNTKTNDRLKTDIVPPADWLDVVRKKVEDLRFGSVQIIVHEGRVTQVDSLEKTRFPTLRDENGSPS
ncbi:YezD family protein [Luteolibacter sp. Populi]|uniref:YezD family protein n=1 Tax=Luteolibacter sp. Populi TaxID=3230487 RepID=UPI003464E9BF